MTTDQSVAPHITDHYNSSYMYFCNLTNINNLCDLADLWLICDVQADPPTAVMSLRCCVGDSGRGRAESGSSAQGSGGYYRRVAVSAAAALPPNTRTNRFRKELHHYLSDAGRVHQGIRQLTRNVLRRRRCALTSFHDDED